MNLRLLLLVCIIVFSGCVEFEFSAEPRTYGYGDNSSNITHMTATTTTTSTSTSTTTTSTLTKEEKDVNNVVEGINRFSIDLFGQYTHNVKNEVFSPYSISHALATIYEGAKGQTAEEMQKVLYLPKDYNSRRNGYRIIYERMSDDPGVTLYNANGLWVSDDYVFADGYSNVVEYFYQTHLETRDFENEPGISRGAINHWAENRTHDKIKNLLPLRKITSSTRMLVMSAFYFDGDWALGFNESLTENLSFHKPDEEIMVPTMHSKRIYNYTETDDHKILELDFYGRNYSMLVILPKKKDDVKGFADSFSLERLNDWKSDLQERRVEVYLPRFEISRKYNVKYGLYLLDMETVLFLAANFSGMTEAGGLYINYMFHQSRVNVDETGGKPPDDLFMKNTGSTANETVFKADHPFVFLIQKKDTGLILLMSRVNDPNDDEWRYFELGS